MAINTKSNVDEAINHVAAASAYLTQALQQVEGLQQFHKELNAPILDLRDAQHLVMKVERDLLHVWRTLAKDEPQAAK